MSLALYRKYRSKSFDDVVGQDHITKTLKRSVDGKSFSHAYLLTGLRGVGKTSVARIFAAYVNGIGYEEAENNPDIIEIDAASNRKIDEIRDLREKVNIAPTNLQYKVYIIDEVHMLTREAFNALLKTLEEPPKHCILILATTDYHKLPETIVSRCIRFSFRSISKEDMVAHLKKISVKEKIKIDDEALDIIAEISSGSLRDAIALIDQARNLSDKVTSSDIGMMLGLADKRQIVDLYDSLTGGNSGKIVSKLEDIKASGANSEQVINQFSKLLRNKAVSNELSFDSKFLDLLSELINISSYSDQWLAFEVCLLKYSAAFKKNEESPVINPERSKEKPVGKTTENNNESKDYKISTIGDDANLWQKVLNDLKRTNSTLYGVARMADVIADKDSLELRLKFNFHKKQLDIKQNQSIIINLVSKHNPEITAIRTVIVKEGEPNKNEKTYDSKKDISNISNVFGSAEMLE